MRADLAALAAEVQECRDDPSRFNRTVLGRDRPDGQGNAGYWARQRAICQSVVEAPTTLVPTGNGVGKSFLGAGLLLWFLLTRPGSLVVATAPTQTQLEEVLWKEVERAYRGARVPLGGRLLQSPLKVDLGGGWQALAYSTTSVERFSGHHNADLFAIVDEASGVDDAIFEAISSLNPSRELLTGNPLRPSGAFHDRCTRAPENPLARLIPISALESPHIHLARSPWGLADATWLARARSDYGEGTLWWTTHVLGRFPDAGDDSVLPRSWLDRAAKTLHRPAGGTRMAIDLALGGGGDRSVVAVRDDNGLLDLWHSNTARLEDTAAQARALAGRWDVDPGHISFDVEGIGADFANRLQAVGIVAARPFRGGACGGLKYANLRSAAAWKLRRRLDPDRSMELPTSCGPAPGVLIPQHPFAIRPDHMALMREELQGLRYANDLKGRICLERKEDFKKRLRRSPDMADAVSQLFGFH